jgi:hypothetical protein
VERAQAMMNIVIASALHNVRNENLNYQPVLA